MISDRPPIDFCIERLLPHRYPFLLVDKIAYVEVPRLIVAQKRLSADEWFFSARSSAQVQMPSIMVIEALAQTSGLLLAVTYRQNPPKQRESNFASFYLAAAKIRIMGKAQPGDTISLESRMLKDYGRLVQFEVQARTENHELANGSLTLARQEWDSL